MKDSAEVPYTMNITETNDKEFGIIAFAEQLQTDVVSTVMDARGAFGRLINPSLSEQLINHSKTPVLIVQGEA